MLHASQQGGGVAVAPHHLAAEAGCEVLRDGGNAIEAMVAAAAAVSVVYPHMNGLGGDGFWLIHEPGRDRPIAISAVGAAGSVMFFIITFLIGLTIGTTAMVARFVGEKEPDKAAVTVFNSFVLCLVISVVLAIVGILCSRPILIWMEAEGDVLDLGVQYLEVLMVASVAMIMLFLIGSILADPRVDPLTGDRVTNGGEAYLIYGFGR